MAVVIEYIDDGYPDDCRYCQYAMCASPTDEHVDCYCEDGCYFSHHVTDVSEAAECPMFEYSDSFPKC